MSKGKKKKMQTSIEDRIARSSKIESDFLHIAPLRFVTDNREYRDAEIVSIDKFEITLSDNPTEPLKKKNITLIFQQSDFPAIKKERAVLYRKEVKDLELTNTNSYAAKKIKGIHSIHLGNTVEFVTRSGLTLTGKVRENTTFLFIVETAGCKILLYKHAIYTVSKQEK